MKLGFKRGQRGFTLIELMVVMGILAILVALVAGSVTGMKTTGQETQASGDASSVQTAATRFNNDDLGMGWPEQNIALSNQGAVSVFEYLIDNTTYYIRTAKSPVVNIDINCTQFDWDAEAEVRQEETGTTALVQFVPGFLDNIPKSYYLTRAVDGIAVDSSGTELGKAPEYLWFLKVTASGTEQESRRVEVYKLNDAGTAYELQAD